MTTLYTNGCSWTYGGGLDKHYDDKTLHDEITWPAQLTKIMPFDNLVNLGAGCGSNQRIVRTTLEWIWKQSPETLRDTTAIIQWTQPSRYEYYYPKDMYDRFENHSERWARVKTDVVINTIESMEKYPNDYNAMLKTSQRRYETYTDIEGMYTFISQCEALDSIFKSCGIKYYFWDAFAEHNQFPEFNMNFVRSRFNWIGYNGWDYQKIPNDAHPNETGHQQIAQYMKNEIDLLNTR